MKYIIYLSITILILITTTYLKAENKIDVVKLHDLIKDYELEYQTQIKNIFEVIADTLNNPEILNSYNLHNYVVAPNFIINFDNHDDSLDLKSIKFDRITYIDNEDLNSKYLDCQIFIQLQSKLICLDIERDYGSDYTAYKNAIVILNHFIQINELKYKYINDDILFNLYDINTNYTGEVLGKFLNLYQIVDENIFYCQNIDSCLISDKYNLNNILYNTYFIENNNNIIINFLNSKLHYFGTVILFDNQNIKIKTSDFILLEKQKFSSFIEKIDLLERLNQQSDVIINIDYRHNGVQESLIFTSKSNIKEIVNLFKEFNIYNFVPNDIFNYIN